MPSFDKTYWDKNYSDPMSMDGIGNAKEHAKYLKAFFAVEGVNVESMIDFGFGYGHLFRAMMRTFVPERAVGIEPSPYIFKKARIDKWRPVESTRLHLLEEDLKTWAKKNRREKFDLGICTSVFQYLTNDELNEILPVIAAKVKYLYLTVPTDEELKRQVSEMEFKDEYALHRGREEYLKLLRPHFTFISARVLESKRAFTEESTAFTDLLFRY
jgi:hypothetical protein